MANDLEVLSFEIAKLELARGDILVVKGPVHGYYKSLESLMPAGVKILIIPPEIELSVLTKAEIEAMVK